MHFTLYPNKITPFYLEFSYSFMTVTFVIEAMSIANAILAGRRRELKETEDTSHESIRPLLRRERERDPLIPPELGNHSEEMRRHASIVAVFEIAQRVEMVCTQKINPVRRD
jgi:hypothetical protein